MVAKVEPEPYCGAMTTNRSAEDIRNMAIECAAFGMGVPINAGQALRIAALRAELAAELDRKAETLDSALLAPSMKSASYRAEAQALRAAR